MQKQSFSILNLILLFVLGVLLAVAAELAYGGWIQIPILSLVWWRLGLQEALPIKKQALSGFTFGLGYVGFEIWYPLGLYH